MLPLWAVGYRQGKATYRGGVGLDGGEPELLTPEDADLTIRFSPTGTHFVDIFSRTDTPPIAHLRSATGELVGSRAGAAGA